MARSNIADYNAQLTPAERSENARKGAIATNELRRKRKSMREGFKEALKVGVTDRTMKEALEAIGLEPTTQNAILFAAIGKAMAGDIEAARFVRDTIGEKPTEQYALGMLDRPVKSIDLTGLSDAELEALADAEDAEL